MKKILSFAVCVGVIFTTRCGTQNQTVDKINIVVSVLPLAEFAEKVGGDRVEVSVMVLPGASPHSYEPTPNQLTEVSRAKIFIKVGTPVEFELVWMDKILSTNKNILAVDASKGIELIKDDPHIWLSPQNAKLMVNNIYNGIVNIDPDNRNYYKENKEKYLRGLDSLHHYIENLLKEKENRKFLVYHPSWLYFARDYHLEQIPVEEQGKEPTARGIQHLIKQAEKDNIRVIFVSPQFNTASAKVIAREINGRVVFIDPLNKNYISNMKEIARELSESME